MSVTVMDLMQLPSLRGAKVVGGAKGMGQIVSTVSVLEYAQPARLRDELFRNGGCYGGEIVITGFANNPEDVDLQCASVKRLAQMGEVGIILFYVGIFMPKVDQRLIELANRLHFPMIVMPEGRMDLRYGELISEIMESVLRDRNSGMALVSEVLERVSLLPSQQRSVDTVLKMVSDRIRGGIILTDRNGHILNEALWPRLSPPTDEQWLREMGALQGEGGYDQVYHNGTEQTLYRCPFAADSASGLELFVLKEGAPVTTELLRQVAEVVRLAVNIWSSRHDEVVVSELIRAILKDEPIKMRRLADIFHIDVTAIHTVWIVRVAEVELDKALSLVRETLQRHCTTVVVDRYDDEIVAFSAGEGDLRQSEAVIQALYQELNGAGLTAALVVGRRLFTTAEMRSAFLAYHEGLSAAQKIWPRARWYSVEKIRFALQCCAVIEGGEKSVRRALAPLTYLQREKEREMLEQTVATMLLDTEQSIVETASVLFVHKNTVRYRIQCANEAFGFEVGTLPETLPLYQALAIQRLLRDL